jgi:hypothetical protein
MTEAQLAIQAPCPHTPSKRGTYIYRLTTQGQQRISPLCDSLIALFDWCDEHGWDVDPTRDLFVNKRDTPHAET